ncbi:MAG: M24 family metallopeptidase [Thaumarchaeota archaeon]|nr:M24 family metallopeptidase [Nitrososphaerota archaeon]
MAPNAARARDYMARHGVRALLASSPTNVAYLTGFDCWLYQKYTEDVLVLGAPRARKEAFAVLGEAGDPVLVIDSYTSLFASELEGVSLRCYGVAPPKFPKRREAPAFEAYFRRAVHEQKATPVEAIVAALRAQRVTSGKVAVELGPMRRETLGALRRELPNVEFLDGTLLLSLIRMVKTDSEAALLRKAALINERALYASLTNAGVGVPVGDLARSYMLEAARDGAVFDHYFYSPDGLWLSAAPGYRLRRGEYTIVDSGCTYELYFGDMGTTLLVGDRRRNVVKRYRDLWDAIDEAADSVQAGDTPSEVMERFRSLYEKKGIPNVDYQGHGIGLEPREYPIMGQGRPVTLRDQVISTSTEMPLEVGMVISLEASLYEFGEGSYEVERSFLIGKSSLDELTTKKDRSIFVSPS